MRTEFKSLDEMTDEELMFERCQTWVVKKSDTSWWLHRNHGPFMRVTSEAEGRGILEQYGIGVYAVDRSQQPLTEADWAAYRRDKLRLMSGKGPSLLRRAFRFFGGDAA